MYLSLITKAFLYVQRSHINFVSKLNVYCVSLCVCVCMCVRACLCVLMDVWFDYPEVKIPLEFFACVAEVYEDNLDDLVSV